MRFRSVKVSTGTKMLNFHTLVQLVEDEGSNILIKRSKFPLREFSQLFSPIAAFSSSFAFSDAHFKDS